jgi:hypothetical protein
MAGDFSWAMHIGLKEPVSLICLVSENLVDMLRKCQSSKICAASFFARWGAVHLF